MQPRNAALLLLLTAIGGQALLHWRARPGAAPGAVTFRTQDSTTLARQQARAARASAEVGEGEQIDVDRATAGELVRLPGVGPSLARRIVEERARNGPFGGASCLDARVAGIGAGFLRRAGPHLAWSAGGCGEGEGANGSGAASSPGPGASLCEGQVDLNRATKGDLECLPGIGAARAEAILTWRNAHGGFGGPTDLREVPGLPKGIAERLQERVIAGPPP